MAVPEQTPYIEYIANGNTNNFALEFDCENQDHLIVLVDEVEPVVGTWSLSNGTVVFNTPPSDGKKITIQRNTPASRSTNFQSSNNSFRPDTLNRDLDRIWLKLQELGVADMLLRIYVDRLQAGQKSYIDDQDQIIKNIISDLRNYVDQQNGSLSSGIDNLRVYVNQEDNNQKLYLENLIDRQGVSLQQLNDYYSYLMQRIAAIAVENGWEASFVVDASGLNQQFLNDLQQVVDTRRYGVVPNTNADMTAAIHAAFAANSNCNKFYIPKGTIKANVIYDREGLVLLGDSLETTIIEPFNLTQPVIHYNRKHYSGIHNLRVSATQQFVGVQLIDARDCRYTDELNVDIRTRLGALETHQYAVIGFDQRLITETWTGYNKLKNVRFNYLSYGYLNTIGQLNSALLMDGIIASNCGYFGLKVGRVENSTLVNIDCAHNGKLYAGGNLDETVYGGIYIHGNNTAIIGVWYEYNARDTAEHFCTNNIYITPDSKNISHNFTRDTRATNSVRMLKEYFASNQHINLADRVADDGLGRSRSTQIASNGNFEWWNAAGDRATRWSGYYTGATVTKETVDLPKGYTQGLKFISGATGVTGIFQTVFDASNPSASFIKDISKYIGREITCSFLIKKLGMSLNSVRAGICTDPTTVYFSNGNYISDFYPGEWVKVICSRTINGTETKISLGARVEGINEGFIVTGFSLNDDIRVIDATAKPITENGGEVLGDLSVAGNITIAGGLVRTRPQNYSEDNIKLASHIINTTDKYLGKLVYNSTNNKMYFAIGTIQTSPWRCTDGSGDLIPA